MMVVKVEASTAGQTRFTPARAASKRFKPLRRSNSMLSSTTMVLSSVMPMAKATPASEITLMVRPASSRPMKAAMVQMGMPRTPSAVERAERMKRNITSVASAAPITRFVQTFLIDACT